MSNSITTEVIPMAKRFTDKNKWEDEWYSSLDNDSKIVWEYLLDKCDHAGVGRPNLRLLNFCCNTQWDLSKLKLVFCNRVDFNETFYFIVKYLKFQYPRGLNSNKPAIISVRNILKERGLYEEVSNKYGNDYLMIDESLLNSSATIKDKDKDKDKDKNKDTDKDKLVFDEARKLYRGTKRGIDPEWKNFKKKFPAWKTILPLLKPAIEKQIAWHPANYKFWQHFQTWINNESWTLEKEAGGSDKKPEKCHYDKTGNSKAHQAPFSPRAWGNMTVKVMVCESCIKAGRGR